MKLSLRNVLHYAAHDYQESLVCEMFKMEKALLRLVKSFILLIWDTRKNKLYGDKDGNGETSGCSCSCPLTGDLSSSACVCGCVVNGVCATAAT